MSKDGEAKSTASWMAEELKQIAMEAREQDQLQLALGALSQLADLYERHPEIDRGGSP